MNKSVLGKGLKELLQENEYANETNEMIVDLPLSEIKPNPYQPRHYFEEKAIQELAASIQENGLFQPIIVKKMNGYYAIVAGERRYRACKLLKFETIPAIVRRYEKDKMIVFSIIENLQREDLSPIEEAKGYMQLMRELDLTQQQVGEKVGKSRSHVTNTLGLLSLPKNVMEMVDRKEISMGHARVLSKLEDVDKVNFLADLIVEKGLNVREIEAISQVEKEEKVLTKEIIDKTINKYDSDCKLINEKYQVKANITDKKIVLQAMDVNDIDKIIKKLLE